MKGKIIGFAPKSDTCDPTSNRHLFSGTVCVCGKVRLTSRYVEPDGTVKAVPA